MRFIYLLRTLSKWPFKELMLLAATWAFSIIADLRCLLLQTEAAQFEHVRAYIDYAHTLAKDDFLHYVIPMVFFTDFIPIIHHVISRELVHV